jgi:hypothetical protein
VEVVRNVCSTLFGNPEGKLILGILRRGRKDNIKIDLK